MFNLDRQLHFTRLLAQFSARLDELLTTARLHQPQLSPELIDEIALTTGELMLVLTNHHAHHEESSVKVALSHARTLREHLRVEPYHGEQLAKDCNSFRDEIAQLLVESKKAA